MEDLVLSCLESRVEENRNLYARFLVGPFFKGDALTVATALRRVLLSSVESIAITALYIQGITHEFSTIVGVRESVLELSLNFQSIVLCYDKNFFQKKSFFEDFQIGYLQVQGPKVVYANDLKLPLGVKVVNPTQYIATVSREGILVLKFTMGKMDNRLITNPSSQISELNSRNQVIHHPVFGELLKNNIVKTKRRYSYKNVYFIKKNVSFYPFVRKYLRTSIIPWSCLLFFTQKGKLYKTKFDKQKIRWRTNLFTSTKRDLLKQSKICAARPYSCICPSEPSSDFDSTFGSMPLILPLTGEQKDRIFLKSEKKSNICTKRSVRSKTLYNQPLRAKKYSYRSLFNPTLLPKSSIKLMRTPVCKIQKKKLVQKHEVSSFYDQNKSSDIYKIDRMPQKFRNPLKSALLHVRTKCNSVFSHKCKCKASLPFLCPHKSTLPRISPLLTNLRFMREQQNNHKSTHKVTICDCKKIRYNVPKVLNHSQHTNRKFVRPFVHKEHHNSSLPVAFTNRRFVRPFTSTNRRFACRFVSRFVKGQIRGNGDLCLCVQKGKSLVCTKPDLLKQSKICKARTCICTKGFAPLVQSKRRICKHSKQSKKTIRREHKIFQSDICLRNIIPLDYTLPPVLKVNFVIEIDDEVLYIRQKIRERISIEVWTNGSIHPRQAVHDATLSLLDMFSSFRTLYQVNSDSSPLIKVPQYTKTLKHILS